MQAALTAAAPMDRQIQAQIDLLDRPARRDYRRLPDARAERSAPLPTTWNKLPRADKSGKASELKDLNEAKAETYSVDWPDGQRRAVSGR